MNPTLNMPGAWAAVRDVPPSLSPVSLNKTLYVAKLSDDYSPTPEAVSGLESVEDVLSRFKPEVSVDLKDQDESLYTETFQFRQMKDFTRKGLVEQSDLMRSLDSKITDLRRMDTQLRSNKLLQNALKNPQAKQIILEMIQQMLDEIEQVGNPQ
ncbi:hypothetical protein [uncultured Spirosoma sp.]|uniref:hypothetical protein n=1 Tax=uncultured Spirosoma sp. TaxID=278208 RepID=UPI002585ED40|nr:hypothetical protein [uncultured Spirosoma sp.]